METGGEKRGGWGFNGARVGVDGNGRGGAEGEAACSRTLRRSSGLPIMIPMAPLR